MPNKKLIRRKTPKSPPRNQTTLVQKFNFTSLKRPQSSQSSSLSRSSSSSSSSTHPEPQQLSHEKSPLLRLRTSSPKSGKNSVNVTTYQGFQTLSGADTPPEDDQFTPPATPPRKPDSIGSVSNLLKNVEEEEEPRQESVSSLHLPDCVTTQGNSKLGKIL